jgi:hypothetical protein
MYYICRVSICVSMRNVLAGFRQSDAQQIKLTASDSSSSDRAYAISTGKRVSTSPVIQMVKRYNRRSWQQWSVQVFCCTRVVGAEASAYCC